ncbi:NAD(P)-binding protein [Annulohypoxylon maeteangense]|uniref:NAD(P)-binding protein n=1 Tax=Annulohypoxylon maeteangense TaxID=1927788 RepID=UPI002007CBE6|nr:NAD(P)-binding protein [Annulohypoxylon maeteangense]KAI0886910.1 NAD(P)-binding protein [Annulohypoxylon maeteangense]
MPQTWLITGCSSGFGELFVRKLRAAGDNVIATGRSAETKLAHLKDTGAEILDLDVSMSSDAIRAKIEEAWGLFPEGIDVVVNNAGYILSGAVEELKPDELEHVMKTNFFGPFYITQAILPKLRVKGKGTLLYMSSQAGWHGDPGIAGYCASKFALEGMAECLAKELAYVAPDIKILLVEPGFFGTRVFRNVNIAPLRNHVDYGEFFEAARDFMVGVVDNEPGDPDKAVDRMIDLVKGTGMAAGRTVPLRVPLGTDGWGRVKEKCEATLKICEDWEELAKSTDLKPAT